METKLIVSYRVLSRKPERKRPHGAPRCKLKDSIKMDLKEIWWDDVDWIHPVPQIEPVAGCCEMVMNFRVP